MTANPRLATAGGIALLVLLVGLSPCRLAAPPPTLQILSTADSPLFSTFIGGRCGTDHAQRLAVDASGAIYITGATCAKDFPTTPGAYNRTFGQNEMYRMFVTKISPTHEIVYSTFLGGWSGFWNDDPSGLIVDAAGNVYLAGLTNSSDFPVTPGAYQPTYGGNDDAFVLKLSPDGSGLEYATFLGGGTYEGATSLAVDAQGNAYVAGWTVDHLAGLSEVGTDNFPTTPGAFSRTYGGNDDGWVAKLSPDGRQLLYSTFLGGSGDDLPRAIQVDGNGDAVVTGETSSPDFPVTAGAFGSGLTPGSPLAGTFSDRDAFVAKLSPVGSGLVYSTLYGGNGWDSGDNLVLDARGHAVVAGLTTSSDLPLTAGAVQRRNVSFQNAYLAEFSLTGTDVLYSTYLGGGGEFATGLALSPNGQVVMVGFTSSEAFPTTAGAFDSRREGTEDGFIAAVDTGNGTLGYSTLLGGQGADEIDALALDSVGHAFVFGWTSSEDFPLTSDRLPYPANGWGDLFVTELALVAIPTATPAAPADWVLVAAVAVGALGCAGLGAIVLFARRRSRSPPPP